LCWGGGGGGGHTLATMDLANMVVIEIPFVLRGKEKVCREASPRWLEASRSAALSELIFSLLAFAC